MPRQNTNELKEWEKNQENIKKKVKVEERSGVESRGGGAAANSTDSSFLNANSISPLLSNTD